MDRNDWATSLPKAKTNVGDQTVVFAFRLDLTKIYLAVLKNGFNLFVHFYGSEMARHQTFDFFRSIMMDDLKGKELAKRSCRLENDLGDDFPKSGNPTEHRMQLDVNDEGVLRFRLRLFDSVGYYSHIAMLPAEWRSSFKTKRVVVDSSGAGIFEVDSWQ